MAECSSEHLSWSELRRGVLQRLLPKVNHPDQAEDIAQETLLRAWVGLNEGTIRKLGKAWMDQVSRRILIDRLREKQRAPVVHGLSLLGDVVCDPRRLPRGIRTCHGTFPLIPVLSLLEEAMDKLPHEIRPILRARAQGVSNREIARRFQIGLSVVRMRLSRGKRILEREILSDLKKRGECR